MEKLETNDKFIKAEGGGRSSYSTALLWYAGCLSGRAPQLFAVSSSKAGVRVCLREAEIDVFYFSYLMFLVGRWVNTF